MFVLRQLILSILLQCVCYETYGGEQTYFIKATEDSPCADQPCLTLSELVHNTTKDVKARLSLQFGAGNHMLNYRWNFSNIEKCSIFSKDKNTSITCNKLAAGFTFANVSMVTLTNLTFIGCGNVSRSNAVLQISQVRINITSCTFLHSKGRVLEAIHANIVTANCIYDNNSAGVINTTYNATMVDIGSIYIRNSFATRTKALLYHTASSTKFTSSKFYENFAKERMIHVRNGNLTLRHS